MALVNFTIPNLFNGVSQQPITIRLPNQCKEQINANARITDGLSKRGSSELLLIDQIKTIDNDPIEINSDDDVKIHMLKGVDPNGVDVTIQLMIHCPSGKISATYLDGTDAGDTLDLGDYTYLAGSKKKDIKLVTNGDTTYILNKNIIVEMTGLPDSEIPGRRQGSLIYVQQGFFGTSYTVTVKITNASDDGLIASFSKTHSTLDSSVADVSSLQTSVIADALKTLIVAELASLGGIWDNVEVEYQSTKNWFRIGIDNDTYAETRKIEVQVQSSTSRQAIYAFNGSVIDYLTLPPTAPENYVVKVESDASTTRDDYYLKYTTKSAGWLETKKLGLYDTVNIATMPLQIRNLIANPLDIDIQSLIVRSREVGDRETTPDPSFVNKRINDVFIFSNRLGFLAGNNVIMSRIDEYEVFYRTTVGTSLSSDRVDLQASVPSTRYSELNYAVAFDKEIILFGDSAQYSLSANTGFDVKTASLVTLTEYESSKICSPVNIGASVYFPINRGAYTGIFDLSRKGDIGLTAEESTQHVPTYISGNVVELVNSTTENMLFARTNTEKRTIYVQNRFIRQGLLEQNAWHKWLFPSDIIGIYVIGSKLYITMISDNQINIMRTVIDISLKLIPETTETVITFVPNLDYNKLCPIGTVVSTSNIASFYYVNTEHVTDLIGVNDQGFIFRDLAAINAALVTQALWVGVPYEWSYTFSKQTPAQYGDGSKTVMQYANLTLRTMKISYVSTGKFDVEVKPIGREVFTTPFTGNILGLESSILGRINIYTGTFKFPVNCRADSVDITLKSAYPYPVTFNTAEWLGIYTNVASRL